MKLEPGKFCPLIGKDCIQMQCSWFTQVRGMHPQTGEETDEYGCAVTWLPLMLIENSGQQRRTGAAVESFRNEIVKSTLQSQEMLKQDLKLREEAQALKAQELLYKPRQIHNISGEIEE